MRLFCTYLGTKKKPLLLSAAFAVLFTLSFVLFRLPVRAVLYPTLLCVIVGGVYLAVDFLSVLKKHKELQDIRKLSAAMIQSLPEPATVAEADYIAPCACCSPANASLHHGRLSSALSLPMPPRPPSAYQPS